MNTQTSQTQTSQDQQKPEIHLKKYGAVFKRRVWLILLALIVTTSSTALYLSRTPMQYEATAVVMLPVSGGRGGLTSALGAFLPIGPVNDIASEIEIVKGRNIAEKVIRDLELDKKEENLELDWREIVLEFQGTLKVGQRSHTSLIEITITSNSPKEAKDIANQVAGEYIQLSKASSQKMWNNLISQMEAKLKQTRADLEKSRQLLHDYEAEAGITTAFSPLLMGGSTGGYGSQYVVPETPLAVAQFKTSIMEMEVQLEVMRKSLSEADPKVISLKNQIAVNRQKLQQEEKKAIEKYNKQFGLTKFAAKVVFNQQLYSMLVSKQEELKAQYSIQSKSSEIIEDAVEPLHPCRSNKKLSLMLGAALGLMLGVGFAFFLESTNNTFRTEEDVKRYLELPLLGSVPVIKYQRKSAADPSLTLSKQESRMLIHFFHRSPEAEAYRMLNTNIQFGEVDNPIRTLLITSSAPSEGKTITAANLCITMAQSGERTLLVDADMRRPKLHRLFRLERQPGLTDFLLGEVTIQDIIRNTQIDNLSTITSGATPPNAPQLLASQKMKQLIKELKEQFDIIVFDSSPATVVTDPAILGSSLDAVCLVVEAEGTNRDVALKAKEILTNVDANLFGVILNKVNAKTGYDNYYYHDDDLEDGRRKKRKRRKRSE